MNSIHFYLLNGSYLFTVSNTADYLVAPSSVFGGKKRIVSIVIDDPSLLKFPEDGATR